MHVGRLDAQSAAPTLGAGPTAGRLTQVGARSTTATDLSITTADGDRVTISSSRTRSVGYAGVDARSGTTAVSGAAWEVRDSAEFSLQVEGELGHAELVDLRKVVKALEKAASSGDASKLLHRLSRPDLDTIATVAASVRTTSAASVVSVAAELPEASPVLPARP